MPPRSARPPSAATTGRRPLLLALVSGVVLLGSAPAGAQPADASGWWSAANAGTAAPGTPAAAAPVGPDVPAGGMLVQGGPDPQTPAAFGALLFDLAGATPLTLTLALAPSSASTPAAVPLACPLTTTFEPVDGGPAAQAPTYDCTTGVTGVASDDGTSYAFDVAGLLGQDAPGVAVVPTSSTDRLVFDKPGDDALSTTPAPAVPVSDGSADRTPDAGLGVGSAEAGGPAAVDPGFSTGLALGSSGADLPPISPRGEPPLTAGAPMDEQVVAPETALEQGEVGAPAQAAPFATAATSAAAQGDGRAGLFALLLAVVGAGLWLLAGRMAAPGTAGGAPSTAMEAQQPAAVG